MDYAVITRHTDGEVPAKQEKVFGVGNSLPTLVLSYDTLYDVRSYNSDKSEILMFGWIYVYLAEQSISG